MGNGVAVTSIVVAGAGAAGLGAEGAGGMGWGGAGVGDAAGERSAAGIVGADRSADPDSPRWGGWGWGMAGLAWGLLSRSSSRTQSGRSEESGELAFPSLNRRLTSASLIVTYPQQHMRLNLEAFSIGTDVSHNPDLAHPPRPTAETLPLKGI